MPSIDIIVRRKFKESGIQVWEAVFADTANGQWNVEGSTYYEALGKFVDSYRSTLSISIRKES